MAINVIKHGDNHFTNICNNCKCWFEYDLVNIHSLQWTDDKIYYYVTCPECGEEVYHGKNIVK